MRILKAFLRNGILARVAVGTAAALGILLLLGGVGLLIAVLTTRQGVWPFVTAAAQILVGGINLSMTRSIWRHELRGVAVSTAATIAFSVYLVLTNTSGELIVVLQLYLLVLLAFVYRERTAFVHMAA
jgi:hypothetical protein